MGYLVKWLHQGAESSPGALPLVPPPATATWLPPPPPPGGGQGVGVAEVALADHGGAGQEAARPLLQGLLAPRTWQSPSPWHSCSGEVHSCSGGRHWEGEQEQEQE